MSLAGLMGEREGILQHKGGCHSCPMKRKGYQEPDLEPQPFLVISEKSLPVSYEKAAETAFNGAWASMALVRCDSGDTPNKRVISCCMRQYTMQKSAEYPFVVLAGPVATKAFFPGIKRNKIQGHLCTHPDFPGTRFLPTSSSESNADKFKADVEFLGDVLRRMALENKRQQRAYNVYTPQHPEFKEEWNGIMAGRRLCVDIETNGVEPWSVAQHITSFSVARDINTILAVTEEDAAFTGLLHELAQKLHDPMTIPIGHNLGFDLQWIEEETEIPCRCTVQIDTEALAYEARQMYEASLKELSMVLGCRYEWLCPWPHLEEDAEALGLYNAEDVRNTLLAAQILLQELEDDQRDLYIRVGGRQSLFFRRMQARGSYVDPKAHMAYAKQVAAEQEAVLAQWAEEDPGFRPDMVSGNALQEYVTEHLGLPVLESNQRGAKLDEGIIKRYIGEHGATILEHLLTWRGLDKQRSTYLDPYYPDSNNTLIGVDGYVHPHYVYTGTDSFRRSCRQPNYQNQPREKMIRRMWAARPGHTFMQADFSQIELRIGVSLAKSLPAIQKYNEGIDLHYQTAQIISRKKDPGKEDRTKAKSVNFALLYGGSPGGLQEYAYNNYGIRLSDTEAKEFFHLFFNEVVPGLDAWHQMLRHEINANQGHLRQATGHHHYYSNWNSDSPGARAHAERSYINATCQGTAAAIACYTLIIADQDLVEHPDCNSFITGDVHDAAHVQVPDDPEQLLMTREVFDGAVRQVHEWVSPWFLVPLVLDYEVGPSWGDLSDL